MQYLSHNQIGSIFKMHSNNKGELYEAQNFHSIILLLFLLVHTGNLYAES